MPLPTPNLDDRRFQDLVDDAKRLVQQRCPEWTDHNVSDPGVTLIEAFASMVDQLLYRLNRVPAANYVRFLDLLDVRLFPPTAARCDLTFWLSAEQPAVVTIPLGAGVATPRTETEEPVVVTTVDELAIVPCRLVHVASATDGQAPVDRTERWAQGEPVAAFGETPAPGDTLLFGLSDATPRCAVLLRLECDPTGVNIDPRHPPVVWEAWDGAQWLACEVDRDDTGGLNRSGDVVVHVPAGHAVAALRRDRAGWLRCRAVDPVPGQPFYTGSPRVRGATASTIGGTVGAVHAETVRDEVLGLSEGVPGQRFPLRHRPAVPGGPALRVEVGTGSAAEQWTPVESFAGAGADDPVFRMDWSAGEVTLGPVVRSEDGSLRHHGRVPAKGVPVRLVAYRCGGGRRGNVARGLLRVLREPVPFVTSVENRRAATGGVDGETIENAATRGPLELRTVERAVTPEDYEFLARRVAPEVARVRCLPAEEGEHVDGVRVLVVPRPPTDDVGRMRFEDLMPGRDTVAAIGEELERRRCVGARVVVEPPSYQGVTVTAIVQARDHAAPELVEARALDALYRFLDPVAGGPDGTGWPFGRPVQSGEIFSVLQRLPDIEMVEDIELFGADPTTGERATDPRKRIDLRRRSLVFSFAHRVKVTAAR